MLEGNKLKTVSCSACGGDLEIKNQRTKFVACQYCGTTSDISGAVTDVKKGNPVRFKPRSFLKIGMIGDFNGVAYQIIGRTAWHNNYQEWDSEDRKYYTEKWDFDEWTLLSDEGTYKTIIEDKEGYKIAETQIPKFPNIPDGHSNKMQHFHTNQEVLLQEFGTSYIRYFEGESTYLIQIDDFSKFAQYSSGASHIAEWRYFDNKEIKEVEFFKETKIAKSKLLEFFGENPDVKAISNALKIAKNENKRTGSLILAFGILNLLVGIFFLSMENSTVATLFRVATLTQPSWTPLNDSTLVSEGEFDVKLIVPKDIPTISLFTSCNIPIDSLELKSRIILSNNQNETVAVIDDYFYSYLSDTDSSAYNSTELHDFSSTGVDEELTVKMHFEIPKGFKERSDGISVSYLFEMVPTRYGSGVSFSIMLGIFLIVIGLIIRKR